MSGSSPLSGVVVCMNSGVWSHVGITGTGKVSWSFQCWVPHSMVASTSAANFWAWSPNADRHLTASWLGLRVRKIMVARLLMYDWAFFMTSSFNFRNLDKSFKGAECPAPHMSFCAVLLGDRSGTSCSHCDGQTPGLRGSCLSCPLPSSRLRLFNLLLLLLCLWLLLRQRLFDLSTFATCLIKIRLAVHPCPRAITVLTLVLFCPTPSHIRGVVGVWLRWCFGPLLLFPL